MIINSGGTTIHRQTFVNADTPQLARQLVALRGELDRAQAVAAFHHEQLQSALQGLQTIMAGATCSALELRQMAMSKLRAISQAYEEQGIRARQAPAQAPEAAAEDRAQTPRDRCR